MVDLRLECLTRYRQQLDGLLHVFDKPDKTTASVAVQASHQLPPLSDCLDRETLLSNVPLPATAELRAEVKNVRRKIADIDALHLTERFSDIVPRGETLLTDIKDLKYPLVRSEIQYMFARALITLGQADLAIKYADEAVLEAERVGAVRLAARANLLTVWTIGHLKRDFDTAFKHVRHAEAFLEAANNPTTDLAFYHRMRDILHASFGEKHSFAKHSRKGFELRREHLDINDPRIMISINNLAMCTASPTPTATEETLKLLHEVIERGQRIWPHGHPDTALVIANVGRTLAKSGKPLQSIDEFHRALAIWEKLGQVQDPLVYDTRAILAHSYLRTGDTRSALTQLNIDPNAKAKAQSTCLELQGKHGWTSVIVELYLILGRTEDAKIIANSAFKQCYQLLRKNPRDLVNLRLDVVKVKLQSSKDHFDRN